MRCNPFKTHIAMFCTRVTSKWFHDTYLRIPVYLVMYDCSYTRILDDIWLWAGVLWASSALMAPSLGLSPGGTFLVILVTSKWYGSPVPYRGRTVLVVDHFLKLVVDHVLSRWTFKRLVVNEAEEKNSTALTWGNIGQLLIVWRPCWLAPKKRRKLRKCYKLAVNSVHSKESLYTSTELTKRIRKFQSFRPFWSAN